MTPKLTPAQRKKIWAMTREKGISSDLLHNIIFEISKKEHLGDLSIQEARQVIDRIQGERRKVSKGEPSAYVAKMSQFQEKQISNLIETIQRLGMEYTFEGLSKKVADKSPDQLTRIEAGKVATACVQIIKRLKKQDASTHP
ncbi:hypothetical protein LEP1GSC034_3860 [Leptospira interrogans str. 2003000735]|uniref:PF06252 family protein n=1 Tax=Leptospira interrogans str. 2002000626 TaxID=996803 RepID=A0A829CZH3_LEPIR|nr:hypothetical protein [Leptospira interrogans]EMY05372.1 hypothetical protein LEP1GSC029_3393 [Leptospira interrogans str. 2002000626]EKN88889.1 hypothetical protein LEP1GSC027_4207 [Leptospira interrogans str. 2002000624]EKQ36297.1 hypothetical protein LEP1GSC025_0759 [Leptospira interrogans str. 2002000621]EKQ47561.1 hypothetical protein LEP1GSC026_4668 [Leptospira interrogans str. 2002000623]EMJ67093.1 hypothetical protein LEP1GSC034_3860 [Leptospira interrogans str. 2003000735]